MLCRNKELEMAKPSDMTWTILSESFISAQRSYTIVKFVNEIGYKFYWCQVNHGALY